MTLAAGRRAGWRCGRASQPECGGTLRWWRAGHEGETSSRDDEQPRRVTQPSRRRSGSDGRGERERTRLLAQGRGDRQEYLSGHRWRQRSGAETKAAQEQHGRRHTDIQATGCHHLCAVCRGSLVGFSGGRRGGSTFAGSACPSTTSTGWWGCSSQARRAAAARRRHGRNPNRDSIREFAASDASLPRAGVLSIGPALGTGVAINSGAAIPC